MVKVGVGGQQRSGIAWIVVSAWAMASRRARRDGPGIRAQARTRDAPSDAPNPGCSRYVGHEHLGREARAWVGSCRADRGRGKNQRHQERTSSTQTAPHPARWTRPRVSVAVTLTAALLLGGCGARGTADQHVVPASPEASAFAGGPVAVHFVLRFTEDGEPLTETADVLAAGPEEVRVRIVGPEIGRILEVWDGRRVLEHDPDSVIPYTIYEAPSEHPHELALIQEFMVGDPTASANPACKNAERLTGARRVLGRAAIRYRCQPSNDSLRLWGAVSALRARTAPGTAAQPSRTDPTVVAVQNGERGKPGFPLVPAGLRLRIANDPDTALQHAYGLTHEVGFAFVGSDGTIQTVIDHPATSTELSDALSTLE